MADVLSVVTVGPTFTWVSGRRSQGAALSVQRWDWPQSTSPVPEGWTLCVSLKGQTNAAGTLAVRAVDSGDLIRTFDLDSEGCASFAGLPADQAWSFQWEPTSECGSTPTNAVRRPSGSPDGQLVRRYILNASKGWSFVMLPLDAIQELSGHAAEEDGSAWPNATFALLTTSMDKQVRPPLHGRRFKRGLKGRVLPQEPGHWAVVGHADASGAQHVNDKLSLDRAQRIATYLMDEMAGLKRLVEVRGAGSAEPIGRRCLLKTVGSRCFGSLQCSNFAPCSSTSCAPSCTASR